MNIEKYAQELAGKFTLEEKIGMIHGAELFATAGVPRLGIPPLVMSDGPMGVRQEFAPDSWTSVGITEDYVTYLPCNSAIAATWNRELAYEMGSVLGEEARGRGKDVILAPGVNIKRSPLCGRNFEYFSEDPLLTGEMAAAYIQGVQKWDVAACVKHFAVNNQETQRLWVDVSVDEDVLREIYLPAFYDAVTKGGAYTVMSAYNQVYGEHCYRSDLLLNQILRREWGFDGVVISDWGGVHDTEAAARSELDIEMSVTPDFDEYFMADPLKKKVESGELAEELIDKKVCRILMLMMRLHMIKGEEIHGGSGPERKSGAYNTPEHRQKTLEAARESVVLLKNSIGKLPLSKGKTGRVLVIGGNAVRMHSCGGGSAEIKALYEITPLMGLKTHLGGNAKVTYIPGYCSDIAEGQEKEGANWQETSLENGGGTRKAEEDCSGELREKRRRLREEAVKLAAEYDTVIYIGGLDHDQEKEGNDRKDMKLPYGQDILIRELLAVKPDMVIVMMGGSPVEMGSWIGQADTLVWNWYCGMEGGNALADVLLGEVNPSGKLPETFYKTHMDCSAHALGEFPGEETVAYKEGRYVGYRYNDKFQVEPQFPFGYGLSYTTFSIGNAKLDEEKSTVICTVKNTGNMAGKEIIQIYRHESVPDAPLVQELAGFEKIFLEPGEEKEVVIKITALKEKKWEYLIGDSSKDTKPV